MLFAGVGLFDLQSRRPYPAEAFVPFRNRFLALSMPTFAIASTLVAARGSTATLVRLEAFNLLNTVNYGTPNRFVNTPQFGSITEAATAARQIQVVFRATF
jgi:hypothetical protein